MNIAEKKEYHKRLQAAYQAFVKDPNQPLKKIAEKNNVGYGRLTTFVTEQFKNTLSL